MTDQTNQSTSTRRAAFAATRCWSTYSEIINRSSIFRSESVYKLRSSISEAICRKLLTLHSNPSLNVVGCSAGENERTSCCFIDIFCLLTWEFRTTCRLYFAKYLRKKCSYCVWNVQNQPCNFISCWHMSGKQTHYELVVTTRGHV